MSGTAQATEGKGRPRNAARVSRRGRTAKVVLITLFLIVTPAILYFTILLNTHETRVLKTAFHNLDRISRQLDFVFLSACEMHHRGEIPGRLPPPFRQTPSRSKSERGSRIDAGCFPATRVNGEAASAAEAPNGREDGSTTFWLDRRDTVRVEFGWDDRGAVEFDLREVVARRWKGSFDQFVIANRNGDVLTSLSAGGIGSDGYQTWPRIGGLVSVAEILHQARSADVGRGHAADTLRSFGEWNDGGHDDDDSAVHAGPPEAPVTFQREIAGEAFRVFVRPYRLRGASVVGNGSEGRSANDGEHANGGNRTGLGVLYLVGLNRSEDVVSAAGALGPSAITVSGLLFLFLLLAWPLLRLLFLETHEALAPSQVVLIQAASVGLIVVLTAAALNWTAERYAVRKLDRSAADTAADLATEFRRDVALDAASLRWQSRRRVACEDRAAIPSRFAETSPGLASLFPGDGSPASWIPARPAAFLFSANDGGKLITACAPADDDEKKQTLAPLFAFGQGEWTDASSEVEDIRIDDRTYFQKVVNGESWPLEGLTGGAVRGSFYFERIVDRLTGRLIAEVAIPAESEGEGGEVMWGADLFYHDYAEAVLPGFLNFALFDDRTGMVVFHSDDSRSLVENVFDDTDDPTLSTVVRQRSGATDESLTLDYDSRKVRAVYRPIEGVPLSVLVYYDRDAIAHWSGTSLAVALGAVFLMFTVLVAACLMTVRAAAVLEARREKAVTAAKATPNEGAEGRTLPSESHWRKVRFPFLAVPAAAIALLVLTLLLRLIDPGSGLAITIVVILTSLFVVGVIAVLTGVTRYRFAEPGARRGALLHLAAASAVFASALMIDATLRNNLELLTRHWADRTIDRIDARLEAHEETGDRRPVPSLLDRYGFGLDACDSSSEPGLVCVTSEKSPPADEAGTGGEGEPDWLHGFERALHALPFGIGMRTDYAHAEHRVNDALQRDYRHYRGRQFLTLDGAPVPVSVGWSHPRDFDLWPNDLGLLGFALAIVILLIGAWFGLWRFLSRRLLGRTGVRCSRAGTQNGNEDDPARQQERRWKDERIAIAVHVPDADIQHWLHDEPERIVLASLLDAPPTKKNPELLVVRHAGALPDLDPETRNEWRTFLARRSVGDHGVVVLQADCDLVTLCSTAFSGEREHFADDERRRWLALLDHAAEIVPRSRPAAGPVKLGRPAFRQLWEHSTRAERIALYHLAHDRWLNPENRPVIASLERRGLLRPGRPPVIADEVLREYVLGAESPDRFHLWESKASTGTWKTLRIPFVLLLLIILGWLIYIGGDALNFITAALVGAVALITHLANALRLFGGMSGSRM